MKESSYIFLCGIILYLTFNTPFDYILKFPHSIFNHYVMSVLCGLPFLSYKLQFVTENFDFMCLGCYLLFPLRLLLHPLGASRPGLR